MKIINRPANQPEVISYRTIRRSIGWLGISLPAALLTCEALFGCFELQPSISHYYYTISGCLFIGILCAVGLFLICYKGFGRLDDRATNLAGMLAFGIVLSPTNRWGKTTCSVFAYADNAIRNTIHYACASLFFITLAGISFYLFTATDKDHITTAKVARNKLYRWCGRIILCFILLVPICANDHLLGRYCPYWTTFFLEWGALISFGISWLVKGEMWMSDTVKNGKDVPRNEGHAPKIEYTNPVSP